MVIDRVAEFIRQYQMIAPGDVVLTGFSGGADSVLLLELLRELAKKGGFQVQAVHVHHNLRGEEADRDAAFAEAFCAERDDPVFSVFLPGRRGCAERASEPGGSRTDGAQGGSSGSVWRRTAEPE